MFSISDIAITSLETITAYNVLTGAYKFTLDELQDATIANTQETVDITGKQGRLLSRLKRNKAVTISGNNGLLSGGLLELQTGSEATKKATEVAWSDYITVKSNAGTTAYKAVGTTGAEITDLYIRNTDGTLGDKLEQSTAAAEGKFAYDPSTKALTFSGIEDGTEVVAYYKRKIMADVLENASDVYSEKATLYIDAIGEDKCGKQYHIQFYVPKADFNGEFSIELGDNQTVHAFEASSESGACVSGNSSLLWTYTVFGVDSEDVA